jgi:hypothetical protein
MEVAKRWMKLCPPRDLRGQPCKLSEDELRALIARPGWVKERRKRLASMSWLMKLIKEKLARQANKEDNVRGHFWEGRFQSVPLLDQAAVLAGMVYVDLNPIRAKMAATPEESNHTSVQERIFLEAGHLPRKSRRAALQPDTAAAMTGIAAEVLRKKAEKPVKPWVAAMRHCAPGADGQCSLSVQDYLQLVDLTARKVRKDKRGATDATLDGILGRLGLDGDKWTEAMGRGGRFRGRAVGSAESREKHLADRQASEKWIADKTPIYAQAARRSDLDGT